MWRPWFKLLEALGRIRLKIGFKRDLRVGSPREVDAQGGMGWRAFRSAEELYRVWGPAPGSPWEPFHCLPLFAAVDRIPRERLGPTALGPLAGKADLAPVPAHARPGAPRPEWLDDGTWTILDLPGRSSVIAAVWLVGSGPCQPVCTFDNWPHPKGILHPQEVLAELLRWATTVADLRSGLRPESPPVWICDSDRLGRRKGVPGEFDNRYFLDDSILPGPALLRGAGIHKVVYVTHNARTVPVEDLEGSLSDLLRSGMEVLHVELTNPDDEPRPLASLRTKKRPKQTGFRRSAAGGFGTTVPEPSSGGGG